MKEKKIQLYINNVIEFGLFNSLILFTVLVMILGLDSKEALHTVGVFLLTYSGWESIAYKFSWFEYKNE